MNDTHLDIGKLSEPLTKLVETIGAGIGGLYAPVGIVWKAKAEAKATIIRAEAQGEVASMEMRVKHRLAHLEQIRQANLDNIVKQAALELPQAVSVEPVSPDWVLRFIGVAQDVCEEQMQQVWARILAGEVAKPGSFSKRTIEFVKTLEKNEAESFTLLSQFAFLDNTGWPLLILHNVTSKCIGELCHNDLIPHFTAIGLLSSNDYLIGRSSLLQTRFEYHKSIVSFTGEAQPKILGNMEHPLERSYFVLRVPSLCLIILKSWAKVFKMIM